MWGGGRGLNEENVLLQAQPSLQTPSTGLRHPSWRKVLQSDARSVPSVPTQSNFGTDSAFHRRVTAAARSEI